MILIVIFFLMKEENLNPKNKKENQSNSEDNKNLTSSPIQKDSTVNLSPELNKMNKKNFPSKENFFGVKTSPNKKVDTSLSPSSHSPILNYFSSISPENQDLFLSNNNNPNKLSPNFNYSPSTIFNAPSNNNKEGNSFQNFSLQNTANIEDESKTLQEKMEIFKKN